MVALATAPDSRANTSRIILRYLRPQAEINVVPLPDDSVAAARCATVLVAILWLHSFSAARQLCRRRRDLVEEAMPTVYRACYNFAEYCVANRLEAISWSRWTRPPAPSSMILPVTGESGTAAVAAAAGVVATADDETAAGVAIVDDPPANDSETASPLPLENTSLPPPETPPPPPFDTVLPALPDTLVRDEWSISHRLLPWLLMVSPTAVVGFIAGAVNQNVQGLACLGVSFYLFTYGDSLLLLARRTWLYVTLGLAAVVLLLPVVIALVGATARPVDTTDATRFNNLLALLGTSSVLVAPALMFVVSLIERELIFHWAYVTMLRVARDDEARRRQLAEDLAALLQSRETAAREKAARIAARSARCLERVRHLQQSNSLTAAAAPNGSAAWDPAMLENGGATFTNASMAAAADIGGDDDHSSDAEWDTQEDVREPQVTAEPKAAATTGGVDDAAKASPSSLPRRVADALRAAAMAVAKWLRHMTERACRSMAAHAYRPDEASYDVRQAPTLGARFVTALRHFLPTQTFGFFFASAALNACQSGTVWDVIPLLCAMLLLSTVYPRAPQVLFEFVTVFVILGVVAKSCVLMVFELQGTSDETKFALRVVIMSEGDGSYADVALDLLLFVSLVVRRKICLAHGVYVDSETNVKQALSTLSPREVWKRHAEHLLRGVGADEYLGSIVALFLAMLTFAAGYYSIVETSAQAAWSDEAKRSANADDTTASSGSSSGNRNAVVKSLESSLLPGMMVVGLMLFVVVMLVDRVAYVSRSLPLKAVVHTVVALAMCLLLVIRASLIPDSTPVAWILCMLLLCGFE